MNDETGDMIIHPSDDIIVPMVDDDHDTHDTHDNTHTDTNTDTITTVGDENECNAVNISSNDDDIMTHSPTTASKKTTIPSTTTSSGVSNAVTPYSQPYRSSSSTMTTPTPTTEVTPQILSLYYQHLFPFDFLYNWFRYGTNAATASTNSNTGNATGGSNKNLFLHRELSFTIQSFDSTNGSGSNKDEIYIRYQSFSTLQEFQAAILKRIPIKIDIGAIFTYPPVYKHTLASSSLSSFQPIERELVFDIDLTDYDDIRNCGCQNANICKICWKYMYMAINVITIGLQNDFNFKFIQWFYSGRRGIHCWVCDDIARQLEDHGRTAIANYFTINFGNEKNQEVHLSYPLHPMILRAYTILEPYFINDIIVSIQNGGHGLLDTEDQYMKVLNALPDFASHIRDNLQDRWKTIPSTPKQKWKELKDHINYFIKEGNNISNTNERPKKIVKINHTIQKLQKQQLQQLEIFCIEIVLKYTYPRIDINVSKMRNHLLKSPFCIHPKTGRVCVPISNKEYNTFNPFTVPTITQIIQEYYDGIKSENTRTIKNKNDDDTMNDTDDVDNINDNQNNDDTMGTDEQTSTLTQTIKEKQLKKNKWEYTSLYPYYNNFMKEFLIPLQKASLDTQRNINEANSIQW